MAIIVWKSEPEVNDVTKKTHRHVYTRLADRVTGVWWWWKSSWITWTSTSVLATSLSPMPSRTQRAATSNPNTWVLFYFSNIFREWIAEERIIFSSPSVLQWMFENLCEFFFGLGFEGRWTLRREKGKERHKKTRKRKKIPPHRLNVTWRRLQARPHPLSITAAQAIVKGTQAPNWHPGVRARSARLSCCWHDLLDPAKR